MSKPIILDNWDNKSTGAEAVVINWFVRPGQKVNRDQLLAEVLVEKVNIEVVAEETGVLERILVPEGSIVTPGTVLGLLAEMENGSEPPQPKNEAVLQVPAPQAQSTSIATVPYIAASPAARRLARRMGLSLLEIYMSLPSGTRLNEAAVSRYLEQSMDGLRLKGQVPYRREPQSNLQRLIRTRVAKASQITAPATLNRRVEVTRILQWLADVNSVRPPSARPLSLLTLLFKSAALALKEFPVLNSMLEGNDIISFQERNISFMLAIKGGVVLPVVRKVDELNLFELAEHIYELCEAARHEKLYLEDTIGSTFTIVDLSKYEIDSFNPVLNLPHAALLGVGRISSGKILTPGSFTRFSEGDNEIPWQVSLSLTFDHRITGAPVAASFLQRLVEYLDNPGTLLG